PDGSELETVRFVPDSAPRGGLRWRARRMAASGSKPVAAPSGSDITRDIAPAPAGTAGAGAPPVRARSGVGAGEPTSFTETSSWTEDGATSGVAASGLAGRLSRWLTGRASRASD